MSLHRLLVIDTLTDSAAMRNRNKSVTAMLLLAATLIGGCGGDANRAPRPRPGAAARSPQVLLDQGYRALENQQYDEAIAAADQVLAAQPHGESTAGALYLKGRGFEGKNAAGVTAEDAQANL